MLTLISVRPGRRFAEHEVALASELARRAATAVENTRLYTERSGIARTLQRSLLPDPLPEPPGWRLAALYQPAGEENRVGGDFFEAFRLGDAWMLVVGDVTGRGAPAAALTALMRHVLRTAAVLTGSATRALETLNRELLLRPELSVCTAVCVVLRDDDDGAVAEIVCAGHPQPVLVRDGGAACVGAFGPLLGAFADERWQPQKLSLEPGDVLVLYSDGVLDTVGAEERFGQERLERTLAGSRGAGDAVARLRWALARFQAGPQADDTAVLAVERLLAPAGSQTHSGPVSGASLTTPTTAR